MDIKIDLHLHSIHSRPNGDGIKWESLYDSIKKLVDNNVKIASFSDHNYFDIEFYLEAKKLAQSAGILLLPGIEINIVRSDGKIANIIFIFSDVLSYEQLEQINKITIREIPKRGISFKKCNELFSNFETIRIPHVGKSDHFKYNDLKKIRYDAIEISNEKDANYLSVIKKDDIVTSIVAFSDTHRWNEYPQLKRLLTVIPNMNEISFNELKVKLLENKDYTIRRIRD